MAWQSRDFKGFKQYREFTGEPWQFNVTGFDVYGWPEGSVNVQNSAGGKTVVMMDKQDRLLIDGKKYGRKNWNH